jgi:molybdopterin-containing oxidoreductase family membrane subunit
MVLQVLAIPVLTFESWALYWPSWQEVATTLLPVALGTISISISYRYLPIFPQELELNPPDSPVAEVAEVAEAEPEAPTEEPEKTPDGDLEPAEA